jgi:acetyl esterase
VTALDLDVSGWLAGLTPVSAGGTVDEMRQLWRRTSELTLSAMPESLTPLSEVDEQITGPDGQLPVRILTPAGTGPKPIVVYFHGGGWVLGDIDTHLGHARRICVQAGAVVVSVGYRLAPEHPFPAAFDDAVAATEWVARNAERLGADPDLLVVSGDSAGGQLAASVAIARRDAGQPVAAQLLLYPVTEVSGRYQDDAINQTFWSRGSRNPGPVLSLDGMVNFARVYVDDDMAGDWRVSPMQVGDMTGLAPAVVHTATFDVLRTEGNFYAEAMERAGVRVIKREHPTLNHSYFGIGGVSAVADAAAAQAASDLRDILGLPGLPDA